MLPVLPAWLAALEARGGPLVPAAGSFLGDDAHEFPRGADGVRRLARAVDAWAEREDEPAHQDDERFVEGAGALLGCLLLDHFPDGAHVAREGAHRVRIGRFGFFDPFRAIENALEGPSARSVLADELARAEDEAAARAGVGRALRLLMDQLARTRPELSIASCFEQHVVLEGDVELDLSRVLAATEGESEDATRRAIDKLIGMLPGGGAALLAWDEARQAILPRLVSDDFAARVTPDAARGRLAVQPIVGGALSVALILGYADRARYLRTDELDRWGVGFDDALARAVLNLAARSDRARFARVDTSAGPLVVARSGDGLDGARLLLPTLHDVLAPELGSPFLVAAPHRDALWASAVEPQSLRSALAERVRDDAARAPHRVSDRLFVVSTAGIAPA